VRLSSVFSWPRVESRWADVNTFLAVCFICGNGITWEDKLAGYMFIFKSVHIFDIILQPWSWRQHAILKCQMYISKLKSWTFSRKFDWCEDGPFSRESRFGNSGVKSVRTNLPLDDMQWWLCNHLAQHFVWQNFFCHCINQEQIFYGWNWTWYSL
jgi:hypothetical protein